ncbi:hypothetical protein PVAP13_9KG353100 [Panicum virgatum]|uniref:Uncharacterized protein n=1 Tax=Panicum virgatum TaxID=38727 RepID=A0A8T0NJR2_PANVG|nr:hypothetical protein PVAP13_9KG353100 [Panicum virgatum]
MLRQPQQDQRHLNGDKRLLFKYPCAGELVSPLISLDYTSWVLHIWFVFGGKTGMLQSSEVYNVIAEQVKVPKRFRTLHLTMNIV